MEQRAFARPGGAAQGQEFPAVDRQINAAQDFQRAPAHHVTFAQGARDQQTARRRSPHSWRKASTGCRRLAFQAGNNPASTQVTKAVPQMSATSGNWIEAGRS